MSRNRRAGQASFSSRASGGRRGRPLLQVWLRAKGVCYLCRRPVELAEATREHKLPALLGGSLAWANLSVSHRSCNQRRLPLLQRYAYVYARTACCRKPLPRRALLRCYADPAPIPLGHMKVAIAGAARAADKRAAHQCPPRPYRARDRRDLIGVVE